ncbi:MAG: KOW domain-containing RNA-binding protein [Clostridia bacterium]|nr:KOW domain-containing RNA-binding protein [Clostridia bacterium]
MDIKLGQVVRSKAGRDSGKIFIILEVVDESYVHISDGDLRRIEKPKKKKIKHLEFTNEIIESLNEKLEKKQKIINSEIRKALKVIENAFKDIN